MTTFGVYSKLIDATDGISAAVKIFTDIGIDGAAAAGMLFDDAVKATP